MRFCQPHWQVLKDAIKRRGFSDMVAVARPEMVMRLRESDFDPTMFAYSRIVRNAIHYGGLTNVEAKCPICVFDVPAWIDFAADDARRHLEVILEGGMQ